MSENTSSAIVAEEIDEEAPEIDPNDLALPVPWYGVLAVEGIETGDRRKFEVGSLTWRTLPFPLRWVERDSGRHDGAVVAGNHINIWREVRDDGTALIKGEGTFDPSPYGYEAIRQVATDMLRGVSIDADKYTASIDDDGVETSDGARIAASTLVAIPAFEEAFIAIGYWSDVEEPAEEEPETSAEALTKDLAGMGATVVEREEASGETETFAPVPAKTKDGPGWITHPRPTKRITDYWVDGVGAAKIGWGMPGDFNRCRLQLAKYVQNPDWLAGLCANLHYRALRIWPGQHHAGRTTQMNDVARTEQIDETTEQEVQQTAITASAVTLADGRTLIEHRYFENPNLEGPTPIKVTEDGHVYGHLGTWGVCHIGFSGECVEMPHSATGYAYFLTGEAPTDEGPVPVGQISLGGGHADKHASMAAAIAHYDSTSTAIADVTVGEDDYGVWVSGKIRSGVTPDRIHELQAAALSGDWRYAPKSNSYEMVAALAVNVPGFPVPRVSLAASGGKMRSLTAAGIVLPTEDEVPDDLVERLAVAIETRTERKARIAAAQEVIAREDAQRREHFRAKVDNALRDLGLDD